jgi:hypothetical protein
MVAQFSTDLRLIFLWKSGVFAIENGEKHVRIPTSDIP